MRINKITALQHSASVSTLSTLLVLLFATTDRSNKPAALTDAFGQQTILCSPVGVKQPGGLEEVVLNDNRKAAGYFRNGIYFVHLEVREGYWNPDSKTGTPPLKVKAFGEAGRPLQIPGPLIRIPEGTRLQVTIKNLTQESVSIFGLTSRLYRPGKNKDSIFIKNGEAKTFSFDSGLAGTFLYTGKASSDTLTPTEVAAPFFNSQLYGAFIVDSHNEVADSSERVFMVGMCGVKAENGAVVTKYVINGSSWPNTERLHYRTGDLVNWRVINASVLGHPMHLHGFPFVVNSLVFNSKDSVIPADKRKEVVTQNLVPLNRMRLTWKPKKVGNWLFHCHLLDHTLPATYFDNPLAEDHADMNAQTHALKGMGGLIMGIEISGNKSESESIKHGHERKLTLLVGNQPDNFYSNKEGKGYKILEEEAAEPSSYSIPGPPIVLTRDEPVAIKVINHLSEPTTVHWHGLELDSYYDGVPGFSGIGKNVAPVIQAGDSFTVHLKPPRAGTFMYHTHMHSRQLLEGLYGPLIVINPGANYDSSIEKTLIISQGGAKMEFTNNWLKGFSNVHYLINGSNAPAEMQLKKGVRYRLRVMNISAQQNSYFTSPEAGFFISLKANGKPVKWKSIDKDGMSNATLEEVLFANHQRAAPGTTHDFEFVPDQVGMYEFEVVMDQEVVVKQSIRVTGE